MSLSKEEKASIGALHTKLVRYQDKNADQSDYYEAKNALKEISKITNVDFSTNANVSVGLGGTVVDTIASRVRLKSFVVPEDGEQVAKVLKDNNVLDISPQIHLDAFVYGINFVMVGRGNPELGEPSTLVTIESPDTLTVNVNPRTRQIVEAFHIIYSDKGAPLYGTYLTPTYNVYMVAVNVGTQEKPEYDFVEESREDHNMGVVPVVPFTLKKRARDVGGRPLITPVVKSCVDAIQRTNFMLELNRDFYGLPQKVITGAAPKSGRALLKAYGDAMLALGWTKTVDDNGNTQWHKPEMQSFASASPAPLIEVNREWTRQLSVESTIPQTYFGLNYANPASEGGARISEASMIASCETYAKAFATGYTQLLKLIALFEYGYVPEWADEMGTEWADPAILTKEGERQFALDLFDRGVLTADNDHFWDILGFSEAAREQIKSENQNSAASQLNATLMKLTSTPSAEAEALTNTGE